MTVLISACSPDSLQTGEHADFYMVLDALVPDYGPPGTEVIIKGNNFPTDTSMIKVSFGDIEVPVTYASVTRLKVTVPENKPGDIMVSVASADHVVKGYFYVLLDNTSEEKPKYPQTDAGKALMTNHRTNVREIVWDTTYNVTTGVDYYQMGLITDVDQRQNIYLIKTDPSKGLDVRVALPSTTTSSSWRKQTLSVMAADMNTSSKPVYAMINGDFWNTTPPIHPRGPVHCAGKVFSSVWDYNPEQSQQGLSFVGVLENGKMMIAPRSEYSEMKSGLKECSGAGFILLEDGEFPGSNYTSRDPRTAIGYTSDNIIWMLTVDGRHGTKGMTYEEMASVFQGLGCMSAANLDGGGSAQMLVRNPHTKKCTICNWPSDPTEGKGGQERAVINGWAIVKK